MDYGAMSAGLQTGIGGRRQDAGGASIVFNAGWKPAVRATPC